MFEYQVVEYDVWGNAKDGYDINNFYVTDRKVRVKKDDDRSIFNALKREGIIKTGIRFKSVGIEWHEGGFFLTDNRTPSSKEYGYGKPEFELRLIKK